MILAMAQINHISFRIILFTIILIFNSSYVDARKLDDNWRVVKEDKENNITICYRTLKTGNTEFKGITYIHSSLNSFKLLHLFVDIIDLIQ